MAQIPTIVPAFEDQDLRLIEAARDGNADKIRDLVNSGLEVDEADAKGHTALIFASMCGNLECVAALLDAGASRELKTEDGWDAYHAAMFYGDVRGATKPPFSEIMSLIETQSANSRGGA